MTKKELSQLYWLNREIEQDKHRLYELECVATDTSAKISGMPHCSGISDKVGKIATEIAYYKSTIEAKNKQCMAEIIRLSNYISDIDDSLTRQIFMLRYINGLCWTQVAFSIGGDNTADSVRKTVDRYLDKN